MGWLGNPVPVLSDAFKNWVKKFGVRKRNKITVWIDGEEYYYKTNKPKTVGFSLQIQM